MQLHNICSGSKHKAMLEVNEPWAKEKSLLAYAKELAYA